MKERSTISAELGDSRRRVQDSLGAGDGSKNAKDLEHRREQRKRFQFEATASDDELEDEIDDNLDQIERATLAIKLAAKSMGEELEEQIDRIKVLEHKTTKLDIQVHSTTNRVGLICTICIPPHLDDRYSH